MLLKKNKKIRSTNYYELRIYGMDKISKTRTIGNEWEDQKIQRRKYLLVRRIKLAKQFLWTNIKPEWIVLLILPFPPLELRPMIELNEIELITSNPDELYQRIIYWSNNLINFLA